MANHVNRAHALGLLDAWLAEGPNPEDAATLKQIQEYVENSCALEPNSQPESRITVNCSKCTATVSLPQRDGLVDIASLGLWYFSTDTGWRCPAHAPDHRVNPVTSGPHALTGRTEPSAQCGAKFPHEGETYTCTLKAGHGSGHGVIEMLPTAPRIGPAEPDNDMVICPHCTSQFVAVPVNIQRRLKGPQALPCECTTYCIHSGYPDAPLRRGYFCREKTPVDKP